MKLTPRQLLGLLGKPALAELEERIDHAVSISHRNKNDDGRAMDRAIIRTLKRNGWTVDEYRSANGVWKFTVGEYMIYAGD